MRELAPGYESEIRKVKSNVDGMSQFDDRIEGVSFARLLLMSIHGFLLLCLFQATEIGVFGVYKTAAVCVCAAATGAFTIRASGELIQKLRFLLLMVLSLIYLANSTAIFVHLGASETPFVEWLLLSHMFVIGSLGLQRFYAFYHCHTACLAAFCIGRVALVGAEFEGNNAAILVACVVVVQAFFVLAYLQVHMAERSSVPSRLALARIYTKSILFTLPLAPLAWFSFSSFEVNVASGGELVSTHELPKLVSIALRAILVVAAGVVIYIRFRIRADDPVALEQGNEISCWQSLVALDYESNLSAENKIIVDCYLEFIELAVGRKQPLFVGVSASTHMEKYIARNPSAADAGNQLLNCFAKARYALNPCTKQDSQLAIECLKALKKDAE